MPENATDLHDRFTAHVFKHEQERIGQRWRIRWRQFVSLFLINGIIPDLHLLAAGSLIDFALEKVGLPVVRVNMLYVYPLSFVEFLAATEHALLIEPILNHESLSQVIHDKVLDLLGHCLAIGGMPEAVQAWVSTNDPRASYEAQLSLVETYRQDFPKYAKTHQLPYLDILFNQIPHFIGKQFKYSQVHGEYKKRELAPCLELMRHANVLHKVTHSSGHDLPLNGVNLRAFK